MKLRFNKWILCLGIIVAMLCVFYSIKETNNYRDLEKISIFLEHERLLTFYSLAR